METPTKKEEAHKMPRWLEIFLQYILSPVILTILGIQLNAQLESQKRDIEKIKIANEIITEAYSGNSEKAFALDRMMRAFLDQEIADSVSHIISSYLSTQAKTVVSEAQSNPEKLEQLVNTEANARSIGGSAADEVVSSLNKDSRYQDLKSKYRKASELEKRGLQQLESGQVDSSIKLFEAAEKTYPQIHNAYEISNLLNKNKEQLVANPAMNKAILDTIKTKYSWGSKK